jgi:hypothetical protein
MDDRKKFALLKLLNEVAAETGVQYIFSVIQSEMPLQENGQDFVDTGMMDGGDISKVVTELPENARTFNVIPGASKCYSTGHSQKPWRYGRRGRPNCQRGPIGLRRPVVGGSGSGDTESITMTSAIYTQYDLDIIS